MKLENGMYEINDNPPTKEEIEESLKDVPKEVREQWHKEYEEWKRKNSSEE